MNDFTWRTEPICLEMTTSATGKIISNPAVYAARETGVHLCEAQARHCARIVFLGAFRTEAGDQSLLRILHPEFMPGKLQLKYGATFLKKSIVFERPGHYQTSDEGPFLRNPPI
jgi:hypothetical protein